MSTTWSRRLTSIAVGLFALLLAAPDPAAAATCTSSDVKSGGIYTKLESGQSFSLTIINLTNVPLTGHADLKSSYVEWRPLGTLYDCADVPFFKMCSYEMYEWDQVVCRETNHGFYPGKFDVEVRAHDSAIWTGGGNNAAHNGAITFTVGAATFTLQLRWQKVYGGELWYPHYGTWSTLVPGAGAWLPVGAWSNSSCASTDTSCTGVWITPHDYDMRQITTLATRDLVVALYGSKNRDVVLVVREGYPAGTHADAYHGKKLDFVDNDYERVPGDCNQ